MFERAVPRLRPFEPKLRTKRLERGCKLLTVWRGCWVLWKICFKSNWSNLKNSFANVSQLAEPSLNAWLVTNREAGYACMPVWMPVCSKLTDQAYQFSAVSHLETPWRSVKKHGLSKIMQKKAVNDSMMINCAGSWLFHWFPNLSPQSGHLVFRSCPCVLPGGWNISNE